MIHNVNAIRAILDDGISLIPVKGDWGKKAPFGKSSWSQDKTMTFDELINAIEVYSNRSHEPCEHVAIRCGKLSGGIVCIDVDTKNKLGFGAVILKDFREIYPEIYLKLRIEKTPSGGYHFLYRVDGYNGVNNGQGIASKPNLASRYATEEELLVRPDRKKYNFLELKSEGGLSHCYPSTGYNKIKESGSLTTFREGEDAKIGVLTLEEHNCLIATCEIYNEIIEIKQPKIKNNVEDLYSENPFQHFNGSEEGARVLSDNGWTLARTSGIFEQYQKPGKQDKEIGATFSLKDRIYRIFTTNADMDARGYTPSGLLCYFQFNNDFTQLYHYLVAKGYGKLKPSAEKNIIKNAVRSGAPLQNNVSESGKKEYKEKIDKQNEKYLYGIFWESLEDGGYRISREYMYRVGRDLGFRSHKDKAVIIDGYIIRNIDERYFFDKIKDYIIYGSYGWKDKTVKDDGSLGDSDGSAEISGGVSGGDDNISDSFSFDLNEIAEEEDFKLQNLLEKELNDTDIRLLDSYEAYLQSSGKFTLSRLPVLDTSCILKSNKRVSYKFYQNCYVKIDSEGIETISYDYMSYLIWDTDIIQRDFEFVNQDVYEKSLYYTFINNAIGWSDYLKKCIGFCAHDYRDEESYMVLATEMCENPNDGGGSGKNIFCNLFKLITSVKVSAGSMVRKDNQFLQSWNNQRLFVLADLPKKFDFEFFKEIINGEGSVRKLYKDEFDVGVHDMPKFIGSTNFSFDIQEPGIKRRVRPIEFTDYYIKIKQGVSGATGKMFPLDWDKYDYLAFDNIMMVCIQTYLIGNCYIEQPELTNTGWIKQFEIKFTHLYDFFRAYMEEWLYLHKVENGKFNDDYTKFKFENNIGKGLSSHTINIALTEYCNHNKIEFKHKILKDDGTYTDGVIWKNEINKSVRGRLFGSPPVKKDDEEPPF